MAPVRGGISRRRRVRSRLGATGGRVLPAGGRLGLRSVRPASLSRGGALLPLAALLAAILLALLLWPEAEAPQSPTVRAPAIPPPVVPRPGGGLPTGDLPGINTPQVGRPDVGLPSASIPKFGDNGGGAAEENESTAPERPPGPEHRTEVLHEHHRRWLWEIDPLLIGLALLGLALAWPVARMPRGQGRYFAGALVAGFAALATAAFVVGIDPRSGPGAFSRSPGEVERIEGVPEIVVHHIHIDHFHPPVDLAVHWLALGVGLALLAIPATKAAFMPRRSGDAQRRSL